MKISSQVEVYVSMFMNRVDLDKLAHEVARIKDYNGPLADYKEPTDVLSKAMVIMEEIAGYLIGDIGISLKQSNKHDIDTMDNAIYQAYREGIKIAQQINTLVTQQFNKRIVDSLIDDEFFVTTIFSSRFRDDSSLDSTVPFDYEAYVARNGCLKTDYPEIYNRILDVCITGEGANGRRFKGIADRFKRTIVCANTAVDMSEFVPYRLTPLNELIGAEDTRVISELMCCMAALGEYAQVFGYTVMTDDEIMQSLRPLARHITFLRYCVANGGVTQDLIDEYEADPEGFITKHVM